MLNVAPRIGDAAEDVSMLTRFDAIKTQRINETHRALDRTLRRSLTRPIPGLTYLSAALCALTVLLTGCSNETQATLQLPEVPTAQVVSKRITDWDEFTGRFQAVDSVEVRPRASGYIEQVLFREGQLVKKDDVLFVIDPRPYQADYDRARAGLALAQLAVRARQAGSRRACRSSRTPAPCRARNSTQRLSLLNQQEASVAAAKATLDTAALMLSFTKVLAPDGRARRPRRSHARQSRHRRQ